IAERSQAPQVQEITVRAQRHDDSQEADGDGGPAPEAHPLSQGPGREGRDEDRRRKADGGGIRHRQRSEEHTSELQSLMRISYAGFCLKKKKSPQHTENT